MAKISNTEIMNIDQDVDKQELSFVAVGNEKQYGHFGKHVQQLPTKLNIALQYDPTIIHLVIDQIT